MSVALPAGWEDAVLSDLGAPTTPNDVANLDAWQGTEGGSTANPDDWNPFNTTRNTDATGAPLGGVPTNSAGVLSFPSWQAGEAATVATLEQPNMGGIAAALRADAPLSAFEAAVDASPWGTHFGPGQVGTSATETASASQIAGVIFGAGGEVIGSTATGWVSDLSKVFSSLWNDAKAFALTGIFVVAGAALVVVGLRQSSEGSDEGPGPAQGAGGALPFPSFEGPAAAAPEAAAAAPEAALVAL